MAQVPDFARGWPHPSLLGGQLPKMLAESFQQGLPYAEETLNYGSPYGHPKFLESLAGFLSQQYGAPVAPETLLATSGASMGADLCIRAHAKAGDICVFEEPTYYHAHSFARDQGMELKGVLMQEDGLDLKELEELCVSTGRVRVVYTIPIHQNPTGVTTSEAKRQGLVALARRHGFLVVADEAYQMLNFEPSQVKPLFYHDDPAEPRVLSIGTFSKLIGPGLKVGWVQAHRQLLQPLTKVGYFASGGNTVTFSSMALKHFMDSGQLSQHLAFLCSELGARCRLLCTRLRELRVEVQEPKGGYFVWVKGDGTRIGRGGGQMCLARDDFRDRTRLCFSWVPREELLQGLELLAE
ncbi:unnamed protein product [Effrenium voratum]|nr:unnamed protein product [Effrenium voratum]